MRWQYSISTTRVGRPNCGGTSGCSPESVAQHRHGRKRAWLPRGRAQIRHHDFAHLPGEARPAEASVDQFAPAVLLTEDRCANCLLPRQITADDELLGVAEPHLDPVGAAVAEPLELDTALRLATTPSRPRTEHTFIRSRFYAKVNPRAVCISIEAGVQGKGRPRGLKPETR